MSDETEATWYVLNFVNPNNAGSQQPQTIVDRYNAATLAGLQLFAPTYVIPVEINGKTVMRQARLAFHYVFLRGTIDDIKSICALQNGFSLLIDRSSSTHRYATITDERMQAFRTIAMAYSNSLPFYNMDDVDLIEGDIVEIVNGSFPGITGQYIPRPKSKTGSIHLAIYGNFGVKLTDIRATDIRILSFAPGTTRAYDLIDAVIPALLEAIHHNPGQPLPSPISTKLSIFASRMNAAALTNPKLDAKLQAILTAIYRLLGDSARARHHHTLYLRHATTITNPWTRLLITLILTLTDPTHPPLPTLADQPLPSPNSRLTRLLLTHYHP